MKTLWKKFNAWIEYNPPDALSTAGWRLFKDEFRERAPIRYFWKYKFPKVYRPIQWKYQRISNWLSDRIIRRRHIINTKLKPGWYSDDTRMLYGAFSILVDYVEVRRALNFHYWHSDAYPMKWKSIPFYTTFFYRNPEMGMRALEWESTLDDPNLPRNQQSPEQAKAAREILFLYKWWTIDRFSRNSENELEYSNQGFEMGPLDSAFDKNAPDWIAYKNRNAEIRNDHLKWEEDKEMHIRLVKISNQLYS